LKKGGFKREFFHINPRSEVYYLNGAFSVNRKTMQFFEPEKPGICRIGFFISGGIKFRYSFL